MSAQLISLNSDKKLDDKFSLPEAGMDGSELNRNILLQNGCLWPLITNGFVHWKTWKMSSFFLVSSQRCWMKQGSLNYPYRGIKQYKSMVILRDFPYNGALFGLVSYNDPCERCFFWLKQRNQRFCPSELLVTRHFDAGRFSKRCQVTPGWALKIYKQKLCSLGWKYYFILVEHPMMKCPLSWLNKNLHDVDQQMTKLSEFSGWAWSIVSSQWSFIETVGLAPSQNVDRIFRDARGGRVIFVVTKKLSWRDLLDLEKSGQKVLYNISVPRNASKKKIKDLSRYLRLSHGGWGVGLMNFAKSDPRCWKTTRPLNKNLQGTNTFHQRKRKLIFPTTVPLDGKKSVSGRVTACPPWKMTYPFWDDLFSKVAHCGQLLVSRSVCVFLNHRSDFI